MAGKLYYFGKKSPYTKHLLGNIQATFNMSITLDGTKDSCKVQVLSFDKSQLEPYTICLLDKPETWWIVANDKTERHESDSGFFYVHNIQLVGAIELLNARDLTDCAFYQGRYTVSQFVNRLVKLSNCEFIVQFMFHNTIANDTINYIKTYENYTLLSALKDFFGGYNCDIKMRFRTGGDLANCTIDVYSKTGEINGTILDMDDFDDVRETRKIDKNSFGTQVITNADNITATKMQVYPVFGGVPLGSDSYSLDLANSYIRLPSNLNDIEWVKIYFRTTLDIYQTNTPNVHFYLTSLYTFDENRINQIIDEIQDKIDTSATYYQTSFESIKGALTNCLKEYGVSTLYKGVGVNAYDGSYISNGLLIPEIHNNSTQQNLILVEKEVKDALLKPTDGIGYDKGSNKILIDFLGRTNDGWFVSDSNSLDCGYYRKEFEITSTDALQPLLTAVVRVSNISAKEMLFAVKYEPMSDLKIKVDNTLYGNDIQIYNQNGKLTEGSAFSKLLNSYAKEISTDNVTRYMRYYDENDFPQVGQIVKDYDTNELYIINNLSFTFYQNELNTSDTFPYFVDCEITMSKQIAVKSLMVNPNSNIRDYGIPQKHTVKRKQVYRDYCEFDFNNDLSDYDYYLPFSKMFPYNQNNELAKCFASVIWDTYTEYYYQLETTRYALKKMFVTMVDFQDNNIIGYDYQNRYSGFDISRVLSMNGLNNLTSTPIQYTTDDGYIKGVRLFFTTEEGYNNAIDSYISDQNDDTLFQYKYQLTSRCYINRDILLKGSSNREMRIDDTNYEKDPLEIPVFEHIFQFGDTNEVIVCSDVFNIQQPNFVNVYGFELVDKYKVNEFNAMDYSTHDIHRQTISVGGIEIPTGFDYENAVTFTYGDEGNGKKSLFIWLWDNYDTSQNPIYYNAHNVPKNKDLIIYRYEYSLIQNITIKTPIMIVRLSNDAPILTNSLHLYAHQYKLK